MDQDAVLIMVLSVGAEFEFHVLALEVAPCSKIVLMFCFSYESHNMKLLAP